MNNQLFSAILSALENLDDVQGARVLNIANGMLNMSAPVPQTPQTPQAPTQAPKTLHMPEERKSERLPLNIEGKELFADDFVAVQQVGAGKNAQYRLYITTKAPKIYTAIKLGAKADYGCKWAGEYGTGNIFWAFPDKKTAEKYVADRRAFNKEREAV